MTLDHRAGGLALLVGYGLLIVALFRDPASGLATAIDSAQGVLFFLVLPLAGLLSGVYVVRKLPYRTAVAFLTGTYLAITGLALVLLPSALIVTALGSVLFGLGVVALVAPLTAATAALFPQLSLPTDES
jgi:MFS family permease